MEQIDKKIESQHLEIVTRLVKGICGFLRKHYANDDLFNINIRFWFADRMNLLKNPQ